MGSGEAVNLVSVQTPRAVDFCMTVLDALVHFQYLVSLAVVSLVISVPLSMASLLWISICVVTILIVTLKIKRYAGRLITKESSYITATTEFAENVETLFCLNRYEWVEQGMRSRFAKADILSRKIYNLQALSKFLVLIAMVGLLLLLFSFVAFEIVKAEVVLPFLLVCLRGAPRVMGLVGQANNLTNYFPAFSYVRRYGGWDDNCPIPSLGAPIEFKTRQKLGLHLSQANAKRGGRKLFEKNINFRLDGPGIVAVIGASGIGKTSFFTSLLGMQDGFVGSAIFFNPEARLPLVGYVSQRGGEFGSSYFEYLTLGAGVDRDKVKACLKPLDIGDRLAKLVCDRDMERRNGRLSGGEIKRFELARLALFDCDLILCDEPTAGLDRENTLEVASELNRLSRKAILLVISHDKFLLENLIIEKTIRLK